MGGSGWWATGPYREDLAAALRLAQELELKDDDHNSGGMTVDELWQDEEWQEYILTGGTGSVLDQWRLIDAEAPDEEAMMRPLTDREVRTWAPTGRPTVAEWVDALVTGTLEYPPRASGRCTVLHTDGHPSAIGYWGVTAD
ncbi:hypothetical protein [Kitasatospora sp. KL5]|uniref:hypothetical protein n=1 Tax=Kitasatospora sp. KL5 TaxID=3425125 RepID=UPI003D6E28AC